MGLVQPQPFLCRFWTQLELDLKSVEYLFSLFVATLISVLSSVERVVEYLELPQEPPILIESNRPPAYWPSNTDNDSLIVVKI